jgi:hypothetical protein
MATTASDENSGLRELYRSHWAAFEQGLRDVSGDRCLSSPLLVSLKASSYTGVQRKLAIVGHSCPN